MSFLVQSRKATEVTFVKAIFYLDVHGPDITQDNVTNILKSVAANGTLGQFEVEKDKITSVHKEVGKLNLVLTAIQAPCVHTNINTSKLTSLSQNKLPCLNTKGKHKTLIQVLD